MSSPDVTLAVLDTAAHVAGALVFAAVLAHFERQERRGYLRYWRLSWLAFALLASAALASRLVALQAGPGHPLRLGLSTVSIAMGLLQGVWLVAGAREFAARRHAPGPFGWPAVGVAFVVGAGLTLLWVDRPDMATARYLVRVGVRTGVAALAFVGVAVWLLRQRRREAGILSLLLPSALAGYGVNQTALLFVGLPIASTAVRVEVADAGIAYLDLFLQFVIGLGMFLWLLEVERDERRAEGQRVVESEARYRMLVESAPDAILTVDAAGHVVFANAIAATTFGYTPATLVGLPLAALVPGEQAHVLLSTDGRSGGPWTALNVTARHRSGREFAVEVSLTEQRRDDDRRITAIVRDVSDRRRMEAQLLQAQKMEAIGRLTGGIAHDFNNLLTAIGGQAEIALPLVSDDARLGARLAEIRRAVDRGSDLTRKLLAFSRKQPIESRPMDLNGAVVELGGVLRRLIGEDVTVTFDLAPGPLPVLADATQLDQAVMNLVVNGRDAMPGGGRLVISTDIARFDGDGPGGAPGRRGTFARLRVSDTGCGIPAEHVPRIFDPFFTTKSPDRGTGLGLAITYGVVEQHGGWIEVASQVGIGTTFMVYLPLSTRVAEAAAPQDLAPAPTGRGETVLVVEDEAPVRALVAEALSDAGYRVVEAASGPDALDRWAAERDRVALVVCDMVMPDGLTGADLAARLLAERPGVGVVLMSGYLDAAIPVDGAAFLAKPFSMHDLLVTVRARLDAAS